MGPSLSRLGRALAASMALHALVIVGLRSARVEPEPPVNRAAALQAKVQAHRHMPTPERSASSRRPAPAAGAPRPPVIFAPESSPPALVTASASIAVNASPAGAPATEAVAAPPPAAAIRNEAEVETRARATAARDGTELEDLRQYKWAVATQARRFKRYPASARERGWHGTVEVAVSLNPDTPWPLIALEKSSGHATLDDQALDMIQRASRAASVPPALLQRGVRFTLPVHFNLED